MRVLNIGISLPLGGHVICKHASCAHIPGFAAVTRLPHTATGNAHSDVIAVARINTDRMNSGTIITTTHPLQPFRTIPQRTHKLPAIAYDSAFAEAGGLLYFGEALGEGPQLLAVYVDRILKGAKPADLPVITPTRFEFVINLKAAKTLGLTIPPSLLARADQIIE